MESVPQKIAKGVEKEDKWFRGIILVLLPLAVILIPGAGVICLVWGIARRQRAKKHVP